MSQSVLTSDPSAKPETINWKVGGRAGEGIDVTGTILGKVCLRHGMNVFSYREYPSLIRGGHNTHQVHASFAPVTCQQEHIDLLIALNEESISRHVSEIDETSVVFCEPEHGNYDIKKYESTGATFYDFPMTNISREETGHFMAENMVALGASVHVLGLDLEILKSVIADQFKEKGEIVVTKNHKAMQRGYDYAKEHFKVLKPTAEKKENKNVFLTGNQAIAYGALSAGVQFFSGYPMTPTSDVMHTLAAQQKYFPLVVKHVEDEVAAINEAVGASYMGVRSMTASATGGYALMVEGTSLAGVMETPLVIVVGQRPGPATGLPTWTCQSDLQFILRAGHGEIPRVVFTPGTAREHFDYTRQAFYLAEKYQIVVFVLSDKFAVESLMSMPRPDEVYENERYSFAPQNLPEDNSYRRFEVTEEGYSPRSIPGQPHGLSITNSYEHDEFGYATEDAAMTKTMNEKRERKMKGVAREIPQPELIGPEKADITYISWGSTRLVMEEVIRQLSSRDSKKKFTANLIHIPCAWPFPKETFFKLAANAENLVMVEANQTGQMEDLIKQETGLRCHHHIHRYDGRPFYASEVIAETEKFLEKE